MSKSSHEDYLHETVPLSKRRSGLTMGLLWLTMVTCFPNVLAGFQWFREGMNIQQVVWDVAISGLIVMLYSIPACYLGARSGLTYTVLSRSVFGSWGARLISLNVIFISTGWYAMNAIFLADGIRGLFDLHLPQVWFAAVLAVLMAFNNIFGFSGVANFARFLAAPVLLAWVGIAFFKSCFDCPASVWTEASCVTFPQSLTTVSAFVIGIACWGNEPDYWRFGRKKWTSPVIPLLVALLIGQVVFPITGFMMARLSGVTDFASATRLLNDYVFGGITAISVAVLIINYVAVNDCGLYAAINAAENLKDFPRKWCVAGLTFLAAAATVLLFGYKQNFETQATLSAIVLPSATVIMVAEGFVIKRLWGKSEDLSVVVPFGKLPALRWAALVSLGGGCLTAMICSGFLPGTDRFVVGVPALQGWIVSLVLYVLLRPLEIKYSASGLSTASPAGPCDELELVSNH
jgi:purine-cytosine permease-like protein